MPKCLGCSAPTPRAHRKYCDYCSNRYSADLVTVNDLSFERVIRNAEARERMAKMDRAARPRVNPRDAIELAKPHPWQCDEYGP